MHSQTQQTRSCSIRLGVHFHIPLNEFAFILLKRRLVQMWAGPDLQRRHSDAVSTQSLMYTLWWWNLQHVDCCVLPYVKSTTLSFQWFVSVSRYIYIYIYGLYKIIMSIFIVCNVRYVNIYSGKVPCVQSRVAHTMPQSALSHWLCLFTLPCACVLISVVSVLVTWLVHVSMCHDHTPLFLAPQPVLCISAGVFPPFLCVVFIQGTVPDVTRPCFCICPTGSLHAALCFGPVCLCF